MPRMCCHRYLTINVKIRKLVSDCNFCSRDLKMHLICCSVVPTCWTNRSYSNSSKSNLSVPFRKTIWFLSSAIFRISLEFRQVRCWLRSWRVCVHGQENCKTLCEWFNSKKCAFSMRWLTCVSRSVNHSIIVSTTWTFSTCTTCKHTKWCAVWATISSISSCMTSFCPITLSNEISLMCLPWFAIFLPLWIPINTTFSTKNSYKSQATTKSSLVSASNSFLTLFAPTASVFSPRQLTLSTNSLLRNFLLM